jgi:hypothetical protein
VTLEKVSVVIEQVSVTLERVSVTLEQVSVALEQVSVVFEKVSAVIEQVSVTLEKVSAVIEQDVLLVTEKVVVILGTSVAKQAHKSCVARKIVLVLSSLVTIFQRAVLFLQLTRSTKVDFPLSCRANAQCP